MKRYEMIKDKDTFSSIIKTGKYNKNKLFVIYRVTNQNNTIPHFGIAIKNSMGKANIRNRKKRQVRNIIDKYKLEFKKSEDYIIMIRNECLNATYSEMEEALKTLLKGID